MILRFITALFQIAGLVIFTWGAFSLAPWLGLLVAGCFLFFTGYVFETSEREVSNVPSSN